MNDACSFSRYFISSEKGMNGNLNSDLCDAGAESTS